MLQRGEFYLLNYGARRTYQIENPSTCRGFFSFVDSHCLSCPFHVECESVALTEFGYAGRPETLLKEYFYAMPFFYKVLLPEKVSYFYPYLVPKHLPLKMQRIIRRQLRVVYKMYLYQDVLRYWRIFALEEENMINYYSKLPRVTPYFEWFSDDQVKRISLTLRSLISRTGKNSPFCVITIESSGWLCHNIKTLMAFKYASDAFYWIDLADPESEEIRQAMSSVVPDDLSKNQIEFPLLKISCVVVWLVSRHSFLRVLAWIKRNENFVKYVVVLFNDFRYFKLLQCVMFPLMFLSGTGQSHYSYMALFKVVKKGKSLEIRRDALKEVFNESQS